MKIVTCIGDSETWCYGLARSDSWPYRLAVALESASGSSTTPTLGTLSPWSGISDGTSATTGSQREHVATNWTVRNAGVSGDTSRGMKARWATDVLGASVKPDYVIIMCGENDLYWAAPAESGCGGANDPTYGVDYTPGGLIDNVTWMVASARANGITPILASPTPHGGLDGCPTRWAGMQAYLKWLGTSMTWMSTSHAVNTLSVVLSDHYQATYDSSTGHQAYPRYYPSGSTYSLDNIHPNAAGAQVIANTAQAAISAAGLQAAGTIAVTSTASLNATITASTRYYDLAADFIPTTRQFDLASDFLVPGNTYSVTGNVITSTSSTLAITARRQAQGTVAAISVARLIVGAGAVYVVMPTSLGSPQFGSSTLGSSQFGSTQLDDADQLPISSTTT